jgi:hypothetical protein
MGTSHASDIPPHGREWRQKWVQIGCSPLSAWEVKDLKNSRGRIGKSSRAYGESEAKAKGSRCDVQRDEQSSCPVPSTEMQTCSIEGGAWSAGGDETKSVGAVHEILHIFGARHFSSDENSMRSICSIHMPSFPKTRGSSCLTEAFCTTPLDDCHPPSQPLLLVQRRTECNISPTHESGGNRCGH